MKQFLLFGGIIVVYITSRILYLKDLPVFVDEAIYARWAQAGYFDAGARLVSLADGKPPLFAWLSSLLLQFIANPVAAVRLVSIMSGFLTMIGLFFLTRELYRSTSAGLVSMILFLLFPLSLLYTRFGLMDSLVAACGIWSIYFQIRLVRNPSLGTALVLALVWGAGLLTKTSASIYLCLSPFTFFLLYKHEKLAGLEKTVGYFILAALLACMYYSVILLSPDASYIHDKNTLFLYSFTDVMKQGFFPVFIPNTILLTRWLFSYASVFFIILLTFSLLNKKHLKENLYLCVWFIVPFIGFAVFGKSLSTRYLYPVVLPLIPVASYCIARGKNKYISVLSALMILQYVYVSGSIVYDLPHAKIPSEDLFQYANGWPSGYGVKEMVTFFSENADKGAITIVAEGTFGSLPKTIAELYFFQHPNVEILSLDTIPSEIPGYIRDRLPSRRVYLVTNVDQQKISWPEVVLEKELRKGDGEYYLRIYKLEIEDMTGIQ